MKIFKEYLKQPIQNSLKNTSFHFPVSLKLGEEAATLQFCGSTVDVPIIASGHHLNQYSAITGEAYWP